MHDPRPLITKFLGAQALECGPFGLLGLSPDDCGPNRVDASLQQQLDRIAAHREGDTPGADDVRLALHAAAAQLLDPRVKAHLVDRWRETYRTIPLAPDPKPTTVSPAPRPSTQTATRPATRSTAPEEIDSRIRRRGNGAPDDFLRVIVFISAAAVLLIAVGVASILVIQVRKGPAPAPGGAGAAAPTAVVPPETTETAEFTEAAQGAAPIVAAAPSSDDETHAGTRQARAVTAFVDPRRTLHDLRECAALAKTDPEKALKDFDAATRQLADWWARYDPAVRRACDDAVVEILFALAPHPDLLDAAVECVVAPSLVLTALPGTAQAPRPRITPTELWPAVWSVGMLTRLTRERDLPTRIVSMLGDVMDSRLGTNRVVEPSFESGAAAGLRRLPTLILTDRAARSTPRDSAGGATGSTAAIKRWIEAAQAIAPDEAAQERLLVDALEQVLVGSREPEEDLGVFEAIGTMARAIRWRKGSPARPRLLDWFRDPRVSESDLRVLTSALASGSSAEGVDSTMVLSISSGVDDRARLRIAYANAWGIESAGRERASQAWIEAAQAVLVAEKPKDPMTQLRDTAAVARINEAARLIWRGEADNAESLLRDTALVQGIGPTAPPPVQNFVRLVYTRDGRGTTWAERYLAAERSIPARMELISDLERQGRPLGDVDAALLASEAVIGSPIQVRYAAAKLAGLWADESSLVRAILDELPTAPRTNALSDLIERMTRQRLPRVTDPAWELAARRALVERVLGMLAASSGETSMEDYAALIADAYLRAAGQEPGRGAGAAAEGAAKGAELLWLSIRAEAEAVAPVDGAPVSLDQMDRRLQGRLSLAEGPVQVFAAQQVTIAEAAAYVLIGERPTSSRAVTGVIEQMQEARRSAKHVYEQLLATEQALLRLWLIRFNIDAAGGSS